MDELGLLESILAIFQRYELIGASEGIGEGLSFNGEYFDFFISMQNPHIVADAGLLQKM